MAANAEYNVVYEDIEPFFEWHTEDDLHVLVVMLPGFRRDQLKVQVTSTPILKISAQRQIGGNRWRRVYKEFSLPSDSDPSDITAKFEAGTLKIKFPKLIAPSSKSPERDGDADKNGAQLDDQEKTKIDDQEIPKIDEVSDKSQKVQEPAARDDDDLTKEKGKTEEKNSVHHQEDQEKPKSADEENSGKTNQKEKEPASDDFTKEKGETSNGVDEKNVVHQEKGKSADEVSGKTPEAKQKEKEYPAAVVAEADHRDGKQRTKNVSRLKTRLLDFTLSLRPSRAEQQEDSYDYKVAISDLVARLKKMKNLMNLMVVALLVVAFVLYLKKAFKPSLEGSEEQEF